MQRIIVVSKTCKVDLLARKTPRHYVEYAVSVGSWDSLQLLEVSKELWDQIEPGRDYEFSLALVPAASTIPVYPEEHVTGVVSIYAPGTR